MSSTYLAANESPYPPSEGVREAIVAAMFSVNRYPEYPPAKLQLQIANALSVSPDSLHLGNGSVEVIYTLLQTLCSPGDDVAYTCPSFDAYPLLVRLAGARSIEVEHSAEPNKNLTSLRAALGPRTRAVLVSNPDNPTGTTIPPALIADLAESVPSTCCVIVDEAYYEYADPALSSIGLARRFENVVVVRTFSKAYGLAGLRIGYLIASPALASNVRNHALPFSVNSIAAAAAGVSLDEWPTIERQIGTVRTERERIQGQLRAAGYSVSESAANFVWIETPNTAAIAERLGSFGIRAKTYPALGVRLTVGSPDANDRLINALVSKD
jgi:histidinol-phosphate aminotransferase